MYVPSMQSWQINALPLPTALSSRYWPIEQFPYAPFRTLPNHVSQGCVVTVVNVRVVDVAVVTVVMVVTVDVSVVVLVKVLEIVLDVVELDVEPVTVVA